MRTPLDEAERLIEKGYEARRDGLSDEAKDHFAEAVRISEASGDQSILARASMGLGQAERDLKNHAGALRHYEAAVLLYREGDEPVRLAHGIRHVADILRIEGRGAESAQRYGEALALYREHEPQPLDLANCLRGYALLSEEMGEVPRAKGLWHEARDLYLAVCVEAGVSESERRLVLLDGC